VLTRYHDSAADASFAVIPAIDLRGGRVVRLAGGDFGRETAYSDDPAGVASEFARAGAAWIHVVDLDGARQGRPVQADVIATIVRAVGEGVRCEVAGGLRTVEAVAQAFAVGAARVVVGTAALLDPGFAGRLAAVYGPARIAVALDVRDGLALGEGWRTGAPGMPPEDALGVLADAGITVFEATSIARDGLLGGPDLGLLTRLVALDRGAVIASGGIRSVDDAVAVRSVGCRGAIVGRALYEGGLDLAAAIGAMADQSAEPPELRRGRAPA
jgi:phosphoribosylformimino-5-aminoimidazole carboxamide ribotide isomerase